MRDAPLGLPRRGEEEDGEVADGEGARGRLARRRPVLHGAEPVERDPVVPEHGRVVGHFLWRRAAATGDQNTGLGAKYITLCVHTDTHTHVCMCVHKYVCIHLYIYMHTYKHTYVHTQTYKIQGLLVWKHSRGKQKWICTFENWPPWFGQASTADADLRGGADITQRYKDGSVDWHVKRAARQKGFGDTMN